jgi:hypothetical protein
MIVMDVHAQRERTVAPVNKAAPRAWFKDFDSYAGWYTAWGALFALIQPVTAARLKDTVLWVAKFHQTIFGAAFGIACALMFTILQNGFNRSRTKSISWIFAIGSWAVLNMAVVLATGHFG